MGTIAQTYMYIELHTCTHMIAKLWLVCFSITAVHSEDPTRLPVPPQPTSPPLHPSLHHLSHSSSSSPSPPPQFTMAQLPSQPPPSQNLPSETHPTLTNNGSHSDITHRSHNQGDNTETDPEMARLERQLDTWCLELKRNVLVRFQHTCTHTHMQYLTLPL